MKLALQLAEKWKGYTSPNPAVGAVVVKEDSIVGQGSHKKAGMEHAEVLALKEAGEKSRGATLYITLEPCCHYGKTPPCVDTIIKHQIAKVFIAMKDPNPLVSGQGIEKLKEAGIEVEVGLCQKEAETLNETFIKYITKKKPFVILKTAVSLDGKIATATGDAKWISNEHSRDKCQHLRNEVDGIVVGRKTLFSDNPKLNVRLKNNPRTPYKILISSGKFITPQKIRETNIYKLSQEKPLIITLPDTTDKMVIDSYKQIGIDTIVLPQKNNELDLEILLLELGKRDITNILLEGGSGIYGSFLRQNQVDKFYIFHAPIIIGEEGISWSGTLGFEKISNCIYLQDITFEEYGNNILTCGYLTRK